MKDILRSDGDLKVETTLDEIDQEVLAAVKKKDHGMEINKIVVAVQARNKKPQNPSETVEFVRSIKEHVWNGIAVHQTLRITPERTIELRK